MIRRSLIADMRREWCLAIRGPVFPLTIAVVGILTLLAMWTGWLRVNQISEAHRPLKQDNVRQRLYLESAFDESLLVDSTGGDAPLSDRQFELQMSATSPDLMRHTAGIWWTLYPVSPLSGLSRGASRDWPHQYYHRGSSVVQTLTRTRRPNPLLAVVGAFDLTLFVGAILPLAVIALTFNLVAADREQGRWSLVELHAPSTLRVIATRCFVRMITLWATVVAVTVCFSLIASTGKWEIVNFRNFGILSGGLFAYLTFWSVLALAVNCFRLSSSGTGLVLLFCWSLLVIAIPTAVQRGVNQSYPIPPQAELLEMEKVVQLHIEEQSDKVWTELLSQYPEIELDPDNPQQEYLLRDLAASEATSAKIQERLQEYYQRFLDREAALDRSQLLTPLLAWRTVADESSGASLRHYIAFAQQTAKYHQKYTEYFTQFSLASRELTQLDVQKIPRFDTRRLESQLFLMPLLMSAGSLLCWTIVVAFVSWCIVRSRPIQ